MHALPARDESFVHQYAGLLPPGERGSASDETVWPTRLHADEPLEEDKRLYIVQIGARLCFSRGGARSGCSARYRSFSHVASHRLRTAHPIHFNTLRIERVSVRGVIANLAWIQKSAFPGDVGSVRQRAWLSTIVIDRFTSYQYGRFSAEHGAWRLRAIHFTPRLRPRELPESDGAGREVAAECKICSSENLVPQCRVARIRTRHASAFSTPIPVVLSTL